MNATHAKHTSRIALFFIALAMVLMLSCCTPQKRLARLLDKHPHLVQQRDSVVSHDTIIRPVFRHDTLFLPVPGERDTFIIATPRGVTNVYLNEDKSEARVSQELKGDTVFLTRTVVEQLVDTSEEQVERWLWKLVAILAGFIVLYFVMRTVERRFGR